MKLVNSHCFNFWSCLLKNKFYLGRQYNYIGNLEEWWDQKSLSEFENKTECFKETYSKYNYTQEDMTVTVSVDILYFVLFFLQQSYRFSFLVMHNLSILISHNFRLIVYWHCLKILPIMEVSSLHYWRIENICQRIQNHFCHNLKITPTNSSSLWDLLRYAEWMRHLHSFKQF